MIPARLWQISVETSAEGEEAVASLLERMFSAAPSVYREEDSGKILVTVYPDILPEAEARLGGTLTEALKNLAVCGLDLGANRFEIKPLPKKNWAESWKRHFHPISVGRRLLLKPSWSKRRALPGQRVVVLDPGLSFGTGQHPTTLFCLQQLARLRRDGAAQSLLDIGCGSGILAIAAAKIGYAPVAAFDFDPECIRSTKQNIKRNRVEVKLRQADLTKEPFHPKRRCDVVCANLISPLLIQEAEKIRNLLKPGGKLLVAGILTREFPELTQVLHEFNLTLQKSKVNREWKSGQFALLQSMR